MKVIVSVGMDNTVKGINIPRVLSSMMWTCIRSCSEFKC